MASRPRTDLPPLRLVRPKRMYEQIAEQIEALIRDGTFAPGKRLPGERELADRVGISRPSLREALIALETAGLIETRMGDGTYVRADIGPTPVFPLATGRDLGPGTLEQFEARRALECAAAELAAQRASAADRAALQSSLDRMTALVERLENPAAEHLVFHTGLVDAAHNQILSRVVRELWRARQGAMWEVLRRRVENPESWRAGLIFRGQLMEALAARDGPAARALMEAHFHRVGRKYFDPGE
ncbi:MAG TPA: FadR/GntR family transcriptional regulator [Falsiroseomonas sp.]|jgi:DNA-binding FadR family transcriptional regulator|nr:FadR/GntR family transcriptional regulator [Falsiroseomonas sp.]